MVGQDFLTYLLHIWDVEVESPFIESIPLLSEFRGVLPTNNPCMHWIEI